MLVTFEMSVKNTEREAVYLSTFNKCQKGDNDKTSRNIINRPGVAGAVLKTAS